MHDAATPTIQTSKQWQSLQAWPPAVPTRRHMAPQAAHSSWSRPQWGQTSVGRPLWSKGSSLVAAAQAGVSGDLCGLPTCASLLHGQSVQALLQHAAPCCSRPRIASRHPEIPEHCLKAGLPLWPCRTGAQSTPACLHRVASQPLKLPLTLWRVRQVPAPSHPADQTPASQTSPPPKA